MFDQTREFGTLVFTYDRLSVYLPSTVLIVSDDSPMKVSKLLQDVRSTMCTLLINGHLRDTLLLQSSLGSVGEFHTNAQPFDIEHLS